MAIICRYWLLSSFHPTENKVLALDFLAKLIISCNSFPFTSDVDAVRSRSFPYKIEITPNRAKTLLTEAAGNIKFPCQKFTEDLISQISYRILQIGYKLAELLLNKIIANITASVIE